MSQAGPKQYPNPVEAFKVGDAVKRKGSHGLYKIQGFDAASYKALCKNPIAKTVDWFPIDQLEKYSPYEKDDGPLSDSQIQQIREVSSVTDIPDHRFTESLLGSPKDSIDQTLQERGSRYGSFNDLAQLSQALKETMRAAEGWNRLTASQKEALEMIQHKIARMLNGDPTYEDNAVDVVGYSTLMLKNMQGDLKI